MTLTSLLLYVALVATIMYAVWLFVCRDQGGDGEDDYD